MALKTNPKEPLDKSPKAVVERKLLRLIKQLDKLKSDYEKYRKEGCEKIPFLEK